jgi:outer membrane protein, multidrug efflux system
MLPASIMRYRPRFFLFTLLSLLVLPKVSPPVAEARTFTLPELLDLARKGNAGVAAAALATQRIEAQLSEANRSWLPTGSFLSMIAPVPRIQCFNTAGVNDNEYCVNTDVKEVSTKFKGIFTRTELNLVQPLFTFGKISAGKEAAKRGVAASKSQEVGVAADLGLNVRKAYYGIKLARAVLGTFDEGFGYLDDAQKEIEKNLKEGTGTATQTDLLRLRTVRAELDVRRLETERLGGDAHAGLRALLGAEAPANLEIDDEELAPLEVPDRPLTHYQDEARVHRPEVHALDNLVAAKRSLADLERRKQYPDLVLLGSATYARATSVDDPQNAFYNDPFNVAAVGMAAAVRLPLDLGVRNARAAQAQADADETELRRREALAGVRFEVQRAFNALTEARKRVTVVKSGERAAKAWITALAQNLAAGLAETKDFADALVAFFQFRVRVLQAAFDFNIAAATMARTTGTDVATAPAPPATPTAEAGR